MKRLPDDDRHVQEDVRNVFPQFISSSCLIRQGQQKNVLVAFIYGEMSHVMPPSLVKTNSCPWRNLWLFVVNFYTENGENFHYDLVLFCVLKPRAEDTGAGFVGLKQRLVVEFVASLAGVFPRSFCYVYLLLSMLYAVSSAWNSSQLLCSGPFPPLLWEKSASFASLLPFVISDFPLEVQLC